jgi:hypothetical protein
MSNGKKALGGWKTGEGGLIRIAGLLFACYSEAIG